MERIILSIQERLRTKVLELQTIDEDFGQLDTDEDAYPVYFPCALISVTDIQWSTLNRKQQYGIATVKITIAVDSYDDTHQGSGTNQKMVDNYKVIRNCHANLQGFGGKIIPVVVDGVPSEIDFIDNNFGALSRIGESTQIYPGAIKAYSKIYNCQVWDNDAKPIIDIIETPDLNVDSEIEK